jgi:hypothetical protein
VVGAGEPPGFHRMKAKHSSHNIEFKRQVAQEFIADALRGRPRRIFLAC